MGARRGQHLGELRGPERRPRHRRHRARQQIVHRLALAGQPDSVAVSPDKRYAAIVIENERDEDVNDGLIPQLPAGSLQVLDLQTLELRTVALTGMAQTAPEDPEPEFVDINRRNQAVVSLQENNHLAIVDLERARVIRHFPAGSATVRDVDATEEELGPQGQGLIELDDTITRRREPDAVHWIDDDTFATANEGDYDDGDRGGRLARLHPLQQQGQGRVRVRLELRARDRARRALPAGARGEQGQRAGGPRGRREPRAHAAAGRLRARQRRSASTTSATASRASCHVIPTGIGPEGIRAIPERGLLAVSAETDGLADGLAIRSIVTLYELDRGAPAYPYVKSRERAARAADPVGRALRPLRRSRRPRRLVGGQRLYLAQAWLYKVDAGRTPPLITKRIPVGVPDTDDQTKGEFDFEGVVARREGGFWFASEGRTNAGSSRPNLLVRTDAGGTILKTRPAARLA